MTNLFMSPDAVRKVTFAALPKAELDAAPPFGSIREAWSLR